MGRDATANFDVVMFLARKLPKHLAGLQGAGLVSGVHGPWLLDGALGPG